MTQIPTLYFITDKKRCKGIWKKKDAARSNFVRMETQKQLYIWLNHSIETQLSGYCFAEENMVSYQRSYKNFER